MLTERKLTERELDHREVVLKNLLKNKSNLVKKYGKDAEKVMYGIATKKAKKKIEQMNLDTIKELVRTQLEASPTSTTTDIDANKSYSGGADYGSEVSANSAENSIEQGETQPLHYSLEEGHGLDQGDIDVLKNLITQLKDGGDLRLDVAGRKSFIRVLNFIIKSNILQDKTKDLSKGKVDEIGVGVVQDPAIYEAFLTIIGILGAGAGAAKTAEYLSNNADKVIDWVADNAPKYLDQVKDYIAKKVKLNEARYSQFKKTTEVRTPTEQIHRAVREIRRKIDEISKVVGHTERMKNELKQSNEGMHYLKRTRNAINKISEKIQELNNRIKGLTE